ncbi:hypothetical protein [Nocardioides sp.]|uniref:hypothetical protein n=1 Tax=Nocardioides sp. TaxID=35761 RepID=UPI00271A60E8|nr:hypothetical protein [Nocardioides sp.]MDO9456797.1 hypothetical protein [Nocardioides sp.]
MREPPAGVAEAVVLDVVRGSWQPRADAIAHLPVGFGAHHWAVSVDGTPTLFVTLDALGKRHDLRSLRSTYGATSALARAGLDFVHASLEPWAVPLGGGALSSTPWLEGVRPSSLDLAATAEALHRLHTTPPPSGLRQWRPLVGPGLADDLADRVRPAWRTGPFGELARAAIADRLSAVTGWVAAYHALAAEARARTWVPTHGEPGLHNQLVTPTGLRLVDWESLMLAPAERDLLTLGTGDPAMLEMFDLEWRLVEVSQYATWFEATHTGTADDEVALQGLLDELGA